MRTSPCNGGDDTPDPVSPTREGTERPRSDSARQKTPEGYYNIERMIKFIAAKGKVAT